jgi:hypothetical protein
MILPFSVAGGHGGGQREQGKYCQMPWLFVHTLNDSLAEMDCLFCFRISCSHLGLIVGTLGYQKANSRIYKTTHSEWYVPKARKMN